MIPKLIICAYGERQVKLNSKTFIDKMKNKLFAVDGNWYLHRAYYTINPKYREVKDALTYSFLSMICKDACMTGCNHLLVAFDGPEVFRYKLYPEYKANRSEAKEGTAIREGFKDVYEYLPFVLISLGFSLGSLNPMMFSVRVLPSTAKSLTIFSAGQKTRTPISI